MMSREMMIMMMMMMMMIMMNSIGDHSNNNLCYVFCSRQDTNNTAWLRFTTSMVWVSMRLNMLATVLLVAVTFAAVITEKNAGE